MSGARRVWAIARADFLERVRRHGFLVTLGITVYAAYLFLPPNGSSYATMRFGDHRGIYNSAWVGSAEALLTGTFLGLAGFYLVKNALERDRGTGVGEILAATPLGRLAYLAGKGLSNFAVLACIVAVVALGAGVMQMVRGEEPRLEPLRLLLPFAIFTLPAMAAVAATAVLFEVVPWLRGGLGNAVYFFVWMASLTAGAVGGWSAADLTGAGLLVRDMAQACHAAYPAYDPAVLDVSLLNVRSEGGWTLATFRWEGSRWGAWTLGRLAWVAAAGGLLALAALLFDRFEDRHAPERTGRRARAPRVRGETEAAATVAAPAARPARLPRLRHRGEPSLAGVAAAELWLMARDMRRGWLLVAAGLFVASLLAPLPAVRQAILPALWIWPMLHWSPLGNREARQGTEALLYSTPHSSLRLPVAQWLAGSALGWLLASGVALRMAAAGEAGGVLALLAGGLFVSALALATGTWSGSGKLYEVSYLLLWYLGPVNRIGIFDYTGVSAPAAPAAGLWAGLALLLVALALVGRRRRGAV